jgi:hypothetical protein
MRPNPWEEYSAIGRSDRELARWNDRNTLDPLTSPWEGLPLQFGGPKRHEQMML